MPKECLQPTRNLETTQKTFYRADRPLAGCAIAFTWIGEAIGDRDLRLAVRTWHAG